MSDERCNERYGHLWRVLHGRVDKGAECLCGAHLIDRTFEQLNAPLLSTWGIPRALSPNPSETGGREE